MLELFGVLTPILLIDVLNPVLLALLIFAAGSSRPVSNSASFLLGHTLAYFAVGVAVSFGVEKIANRMANPQAVDFLLGAIVGLVCIYFALKPADETSETEMPTWELTPLKCLGFGAAVNFIGAPFALPYIGAIDQILKADLGVTQGLLVLGVYNLAYALPFAVVPLAVVSMGEGAKPLLQRMNALMESLSDKLMPKVLLLLGLWLLVDAGYFAVTGEVLI